MPDKKRFDVLFLSQVNTPSVSLPRVTMGARLAARMRAAKYDRMLAVGVRAPAGSALSAHEARLTSMAEREAVARALRRALTDARDGAGLSSRVPLNIPNLIAAEQVVDEVTLRLHSPRPVSARGMARLRRVLSDGSGPFYRFGHGDLRGRLGAALAAL
jgi:hypothetical protein